jgi:hypothetical protein
MRIANWPDCEIIHYEGGLGIYTKIGAFALIDGVTQKLKL